jgi:hypothetical protein
MNQDRRNLVKAGAAALAIAGNGSAALAAPPAPSVTALTAAGLDPMTTYRRMFADLRDGSECCWWYFGTLPTNVEDVGAVATAQVDTLMAYRVENAGAGAFKVHWTEVGVFRDIATGAVATPWFNPITGKDDPRRAHFADGPATYTIRKDGSGLAIALEQARATIKGVVVTANVTDDRVCLTQFEDKVRAMGSGPAMDVRTTLKIYASLAALQQPGDAVSARGFYSVRVLNTGATTVSGLMQKARMDEPLNPVAWERMRAAYPAFFDGPRVARVP